MEKQKVTKTETLIVAKSSVTKPPFADFIAILHPNTMKKFNLHDSDNIILKNTIKSEDDEKTKTLRISSPIISSTNKLIDISNSKSNINENEISLDQTYRSALGVGEGDPIDVEFHDKKMGYTEIILNKMDYQKSVVRVQSNTTYMERRTPIVCICEEMLNSIGATYGDKIVIESHNKKIRAQCAPLTPVMQKFHDYVSSPSHDKVKHDELGKEIADYFTIPSNWNLQYENNPNNGDLIHPIFMDSVGRKSLRSKDGKIFPLHPVKIRRSLGWDILKKLNSFGSMSLLGLSVSSFGLVSNIGKDDQITFSLMALGFGIWGAWSILTSSKYKTK